MLRVYSEHWCEAVIGPSSLRGHPDNCGGVATSLCGVCHTPLCQSHEICCPSCYAVTCLKCDHACVMNLQDQPIEAA